MVNITIQYQEKMELIHEKRFTKELLQKLQDFSVNYNRIQVIREKAGTLCRPTVPRFTILTEDLIESLCLSEEVSGLSQYREQILNFSLLFEEFIIIGDDILDSYNEQQNSHNFKKLLDHVIRFSIIPWESQKYLHGLPGNQNQVIFDVLNKMKTAGEMEFALRENPKPITAQQFGEFTENRNMNFFIYYSLLAPFLSEDTKSWLQKFLFAYIKLDSLLDDMCDVWDDARHQTFNALLFKAQQDRSAINRSSEPQFKRSLIKGKIYDYAIDLGLQYANQAIDIIGSRDTPFSNYLKLLVNGCKEGLRIYQQNQFFELIVDSIQTHQNLTTFLLKPYPWSRLALEEVLPKMKKNG